MHKESAISSRVTYPSAASDVRPPSDRHIKQSLSESRDLLYSAENQIEAILQRIRGSCPTNGAAAPNHAVENTLMEDVADNRRTAERIAALVDDLGKLI